MRVTVLLHQAGASEVTGTALGLIERLLAKGHRVSVFAHDEAAALSAGDGAAARMVAALLRRGAHGPGLDWIVEDMHGGNGAAQAPGVLRGDHADLWALVREADVVLTPVAGS